MSKYLYFVTECVHAAKDVLWEDNKLCRLECEKVTRSLAL